jgi:N-acetylneuraminic acid mutarotase
VWLLPLVPSLRFSHSGDKSFATDIPSENRAIAGQFHTTDWSVVLTAGDTAIPGAREAFQMGENF